MRFLLLLLPLLLCAPLHAHAKPPGLVDQLLSVLGSENLPPVKMNEDAPILPPVKKPDEPKKVVAQGGLEIGTNFLPVYNLDNGLDHGSDAKPMLLPFFSSAPIAAPQRNILSLIIMIPDSDRDAARAYSFAKAAQDAASAKNPEWYASSGLVFTPQFLNPEDVANNKDRFPDGGASLLKFTGAGWIYGADNVMDAGNTTISSNRTMSSYEVLDFVLLAIARKELFPDLERVVIAGGGAGGDFVQRYAALGQAPDILANDGIKLRFVAANAWSYLYFDKQRLREKTDLDDTGSLFAEPKKDSCTGYNLFPYGLDALPPFGRRQGDTAIRLRYDQRVVLYLTGKNATRALPDTAPQSCALKLQGKNLNQRAQTFYQHLTKLYGDTISQTQRLNEIPDAGEEAPPIWASPCGLSVLYGDGACDTAKKGL
jgi:hypothetical protein